MEIRKRYKEHLVICILRRSQHLEHVKTGLENAVTYHSFSRLANALDRVPLPNWERLRLASLAVANEPLLAENTTVLLRDRPDVSWESSIEDLPRDRMWAFNVTAEVPFSRAKLEYYTAKGEKVIEMDSGRFGGYDGYTIRGELRAGRQDLSFLPSACHDYFRDNCLKYFSSV